MSEYYESGECDPDDLCGTGSKKSTRTCTGADCPSQADNMAEYSIEKACDTLQCGDVTETDIDYPCKIFRIDCRDTLTMSIICKL